MSITKKWYEKLSDPDSPLSYAEVEMFELLAEVLESEIKRLQAHPCANCGYKYTHLDDEGGLRYDRHNKNTKR